jgi:hypothetical protein
MRLTEVRQNVVLLEIVQLHVLHDSNDLERPLVRKYGGLQECNRICVVMRRYAAAQIEGARSTCRLKLKPEPSAHSTISAQQSVPDEVRRSGASGLT